MNDSIKMFFRKMLVFCVAAAACMCSLEEEVRAQPLTITLNDINCNSLTNEYTIDIEVNGAYGEPYQITGAIEGSTDDLGNPFTIGPFPDGEPFIISAASTNGIDTLTETYYSNPVTCIPCYGSYIEPLPTVRRAVCDGNVYMPTPNFDIGFEELLIAYLHTDSILTPDNILLTKNVQEGEVFGLEEPLQTNTEYYLSFAASDFLGTDGLPDLNHYCTTISTSQPIVFLEPITVFVEEVCNPDEDEQDFIIEVTGGYPAFDNETSYLIEGTIYMPIAIGEVLTLGPLPGNLSWLLVVSDIAGCGKEISGSSYCGPPSLVYMSETETICDETTNEVTISYYVGGGYEGEYDFYYQNSDGSEGQGNTAEYGNPFTIGPFAEGSVLTIGASSTNGTDTVTIDYDFGPLNCSPCNEYFINPLPTDRALVCSGDTYMPSPEFDPYAWPIAYIHTEPELTPDNILLTKEVLAEEVFSLEEPLQTNTEYYISFVASDSLGIDGLPDLSNDCTTITNSQPIVFLEPITISILEEDCDFETADGTYLMELTGGYPAFDNEVSYTISGVTNLFVNFGDVFIIGPLSVGTPWELYVSDAAGCFNQVTRIVECESEPILPLIISVIDTICNETTNEIMLTFSAEGGYGEPYFYYYVDAYGNQIEGYTADVGNTFTIGPFLGGTGIEVAVENFGDGDFLVELVEINPIICTECVEISIADLPSEPSYICAGDEALVNPTYEIPVDGNILAYLHSSSNLTSSNIIATADFVNGETFSAGDDILANTQYYISVAGGNLLLADGSPDLMHYCTLSTNSMPVVFLEEILLTYEVNPCDGNPDNVTYVVDLQGGLPAFDAASNYAVEGAYDGTLPQGTFLLGPLSEGDNWSITATDDLGCSQNIEDAAACPVQCAIEIATIEICNDYTGTFNLSANATGFNTGYEWTLTTEDGTILTQSGETVSWEEVAINQTFELLVVDQDGCTDTYEGDAPECLECPSIGVGAMPSETVYVCDGDATSITAADIQTESGVIVQYIVHTSPEVPNGTTEIILAAASGEFNLADGLTSNTQYYVSPVLGVVDVNDDGVADLDHPCTLSVAGVPLVFLAPLSIDLVSENCDMLGESSYTLEVNGGYPAFAASIGENATFEITGIYTDEVAIGSFTTNNILDETEWSLTALDEQGCETTITGEVDCPLIYGVGDLNGEATNHAQILQAQMQANGIQVQAHFPKHANTNLYLTDITGRTIYQQKLLAEPGSQSLHMPLQTSNLASGLYLVTLSDEKGNRTTVKVFK